MSDPLSVLAALSVPRTGHVFELAEIRTPGMPMPELHPQLVVLPFRTPRGLLRDDEHRWPGGEDNVKDIAFTSDYVTMTTHTGTHVDALGHISRGVPPRWRGGDELGHVGDFGLTAGGAGELGPILGRGVLLDIPRVTGRPHLAAGEGVDAALLQRAIDQQELELRAGDIALIRTGMGALRPDRTLMRDADGAGLTSSGAELLLELGIAAIGSDTEAVEQQPSTTPGNPHPVHELLLLEHGVPMIELLQLEELAAEGSREFLFIAGPVKIAGATAGLTDPIAIT